MEYKCVNCGWNGEELTKQSKGAMWNNKCPVCGDEVMPKSPKKQEVAETPEPVQNKKPKKKVNMDLNGDGEVNAKDFSMAAKVLSRSRGRKKKVTKR